MESSNIYALGSLMSVGKLVYFDPNIFKLDVSAAVRETNLVLDMLCTNSRSLEQVFDHVFYTACHRQAVFALAQQVTDKLKISYIWNHLFVHDLDKMYMYAKLMPLGVKKGDISQAHKDNSGHHITINSTKENFIEAWFDWQSAPLTKQVFGKYGDLSASDFLIQYKNHLTLKAKPIFDILDSVHLDYPLRLNSKTHAVTFSLARDQIRKWEMESDTFKELSINQVAKILNENLMQ